MDDSTRARMLVALLFLSYICIVTINVLWLFLIVPRVGLQCVIVVFPDDTHLHFREHPKNKFTRYSQSSLQRQCLSQNNLTLN